MSHLPAVALLLDMDGTLVDSTAVVEASWTAWADRAGVPAADVLAHAHGSPSRDVIARFLTDADEIAAETLWVEGLETPAGAEVALAGAERILSQQLLPLAIVTSATNALAAARLERVGLPVPDVLVGADDTERGKPDPAPYLLAAERLGVDPTACIGVEDTPAGLAALAAAGVPAIAVGSTYPRPALTPAYVVLPDLGRLRVSAGAVHW